MTNLAPKSSRPDSSPRPWRIPRLRARYGAAVALYCVFIFIISAQSEPPKPELGFEIPGLDKLAHAVLYGGLAGVTAVGLRQSNAELQNRVLFFGPIVFAVLYGVTDEVHQLFVPERTFEWADLIADGTGAVVVQMILCGLVWRVWPRDTTRAT